MSVVDALPASAASSAASSSNAFSAMDSSEFVKIIFTELANQDPLAPSDSQALLEQISTIRSIQSSIDMSSRLESLVGQNEWTSAAGLIGKKISGVSEELLRVDGVVKSVSRTDEGAVLNLESGKRVPVSWVDEILSTTPAVTP
jgi:flagellar basal-body rod modification protein FlgD